MEMSYYSSIISDMVLVMIILYERNHHETQAKNGKNGSSAGVELTLTAQNQTV